MMQASFWLALDWMGWSCYDWKHKNLTEQWMFAATWLVNWTQHPESSNSFAWCTLAGYNLQSKSVRNPFRCDFQCAQMWLRERRCWGWDGIPSLCHPIGLHITSSLLGWIGVSANLEPVPLALKMTVWQKSLQRWQFCISMLPPSRLKY